MMELTALVKEALGGKPYLSMALYRKIVAALQASKVEHAPWVSSDGRPGWLFKHGGKTYYIRHSVSAEAKITLSKWPISSALALKATAQEQVTRVMQMRPVVLRHSPELAGAFSTCLANLQGEVGS